jgi:hypothetical protein
LLVFTSLVAPCSQTATIRNNNLLGSSAISVVSMKANGVSAPRSRRHLAVGDFFQLRNSLCTCTARQFVIWTRDFLKRSNQTASLVWHRSGICGVTSKRTKMWLTNEPTRCTAAHCGLFPSTLLDLLWHISLKELVAEPGTSCGERRRERARIRSAAVELDALFRSEHADAQRDEDLGTSLNVLGSRARYGRVLLVEHTSHSTEQATRPTTTTTNISTKIDRDTCLFVYKPYV